MLPKTHHPDDATWIAQRLAGLPDTLAAKACAGYSDVFQTTYDNEPIPRLKEGNARRAANTRLREFIDRVYSIAGNDS